MAEASGDLAEQLSLFRVDRGSGGIRARSRLTGHEGCDRTVALGEGENNTKIKSLGGMKSYKIKQLCGALCLLYRRRFLRPNTFLSALKFSRQES